MDVDEPSTAQPEPTALPQEVVEKMSASAAKLSAARRARKGAPAEAATPENIKEFSELKVIPGLHSKVGVTSMDLLVDTASSGEKREWALTGGNDGTVIVTNWREGEQVYSVKAHGSKKVSTTMWIDRGSLKDSYSFVTGSADKTVKIWSLEDDKAKLGHTISTHDGEITGLTLHPCGEYFVSASTDASWSINDISRGESIKSFSEAGVACTAVSFHPDGMLMGLGLKNSLVDIWDVKAGSKVHSFEGHQGAVTSISFSENGYYLASCANGESIVKLWDLRKLTNFHSIDLSKENVKSIQKVAFDPSAQYLGVAVGSSIRNGSGTHCHFRIYLNKKWTELLNAEVHSADITDFKFGENSKHIVSAGADRKIVVTGI
ncbi:hypothetical protein HDU67_004777 [Dinochytrium kinnereticum]|nr:hypothetical protein HDU67_004777 [Dinochytrium kinnereticum]